MGDVADDIRDGLRCQACACLMPDFLATPEGAVFRAPGYPRTCPVCSNEAARGGPEEHHV